MSKEFSPYQFRLPIALALLLALIMTSGCSHKKTNRGHLFRCDWAFEYNRTPWIGCPPDSGCDDERGCGIDGCDDCKDKKKKGFRRHCGMNPQCTANKPCCRTLGCGMWIDPSDPNTFATMGLGMKACCLTPFCTPAKPCCMTPNCGRITSQSLNQQMLMLGNNEMIAPGMPSVTPTPVLPKSEPQQEKKEKKSPTVAGPTGLLISRGIVPGVSMVGTGGVVAAAGVATPVGVMTPSGVQLPNGMVNPNAVIRACTMHPGCSAARPCGMTPGCGSMVSVSVVSNNAMMLASALRAPGVTGGVMQAGAVPGYTNGGIMTAYGVPTNRTGGMIVNPATGQAVSGLSMSGYPQMGYPPIGYTPTGYSPGYPRFAGFAAMEQQPEEEEEEEEPEPETKSQMPVPRFHPIPSKPTFQRSEGLTVPSKTIGGRSAANDRKIFNDESLDAAIEQAYLEGMSAAMDEVEEEFEAQAQELAKAKLQEKILNQAKKLQSQIESQKEIELQVLEMEKRQELAQKKARAQARKLAEQTTLEEAEQEKATMEAEILRAQLALARQTQAEQVALRQAEAQALQIPAAQIPVGFVQQGQMVAPVNYNADGGNKKGVFASAIGFLKGNEEKPGSNSLSMRTPYSMPAQNMQQVMQYPAQQPMYARQSPQMGQAAQTSSFLPTGGPSLLKSAKSVGNNMFSAVSGAVSPLSGLLGSDQPVGQNQTPLFNNNLHQPKQQIPAARHLNYQASMAHQPTARRNAYPCPPCPPFPNGVAPATPLVSPAGSLKAAKSVKVRSVITEETMDDEMDDFETKQPQKPPRMPKKPKKILDVDDEEEGSMIRQAHYEERN